MMRYGPGSGSEHFVRETRSIIQIRMRSSCASRHGLQGVDGGERRTGILKRRDAFRRAPRATPVRSPRANRLRLLAGVRVAQIARERTAEQIDCARSLNRPVALPSSSQQDLAAVGIGPSPSRTSAIFIAIALAKPACPLACVSHTRIVRRHMTGAASCSGNPSTLGVGRLRPFLLVPAAAENPFPRLRLLRSVADHPHDVVPVPGSRQLQIPGRHRRRR